MKINLLPKEYRPQSAINTPRLVFMLAFVLILFGTGIWLIGEWMTLGQIKNDLAKTEQDLELYGPQYKNVMMLEEQQAVIQKKKQEITDVISQFVPVEDFLSEIIEPLPNNVWINDLSIMSQEISIDGKSDRMRAVAMYMMDIESSPKFMNTSLQTINNDEAKGVGDIFNFKLTFNVEKAGTVK